MEFGWQDKNHNWEFIGNFQLNDGIHANSIAFSIHKCKNCNAIMTASKSTSDYYVTPKCSLTSQEVA